jgi:hypothetical protein
MKGIRGALVLLPTDLGAEPAINPFDQWLTTAGWDADSLQLRPQPTHATLGWRACAVQDCDRPAWGLGAQGLCPGCDTQWQVQGKPDREIFDRQPVKRNRINNRQTPCSVTRDGVRCGRDAQNQGLCAPHSYTVLRSKLERHVVIEGLTPLPSLGPCHVAACDRLAYLPGTLLCKAHGNRWRTYRRANTDADLNLIGVGAQGKSATVGASCWRVFIHMCGDRFCTGCTTGHVEAPEPAWTIYNALSTGCARYK